MSMTWEVCNFYAFVKEMRVVFQVQNNYAPRFKNEDIRYNFGRNAKYNKIVISWNSSFFAGSVVKYCFLGQALRSIIVIKNTGRSTHVIALNVRLTGVESTYNVKYCC